MQIDIKPGFYKKPIWLIPIIAFFAALIYYFISKASFGAAKNVFGYTHEISLLLIGFIILADGLKYQRRKEFIEGIPTSKIRSVPMGFSELSGVARQKFDLKSPLTNAVCVFYRFTIERKSVNKKNRRTWMWELIKEKTSTIYFYIEDETGQILVDPMDAEAVLPVDYRYVETQGTLTSTPVELRYTEWYIEPGDKLYILGTVRKFKDAVGDRREKLTERLRQLKENKEKLKGFDTNKDGNIDAEEWDKARESVEQELVEEELKNPVVLEDDVVVAKGDVENTFFISDRSEKELTQKLFLKSILFGLGGTLLIIIILTSLLARSHILPRDLVIPWDKIYKG
ncbi:MAG: GIDE domain-containing protein [Elusimicrobia bacterium]|nr:GIDE domain-containing protein [Elusimicrobiota bacterium]